MAKRTWHIIIGPHHIVQLSADMMEQEGDVLIFRNHDLASLNTVGKFNHYMGWLELLEAPKGSATVTSLTVVPRGDPPTVPPAPGGDAA